jgi:hypothetical protein
MDIRQLTVLGNSSVPREDASDVGVVGAHGHGLDWKESDPSDGQRCNCDMVESTAGGCISDGSGVSGGSGQLHVITDKLCKHSAAFES